MPRARKITQPAWMKYRNHAIKARKNTSLYPKTAARRSTTSKFCNAGVRWQKRYRVRVVHSFSPEIATDFGEVSFYLQRRWTRITATNEALRGAADLTALVLPNLGAPSAAQCASGRLFSPSVYPPLLRRKGSVISTRGGHIVQRKALDAPAALFPLLN